MKTAIPTLLLASACAVALAACDALVAYDPDEDKPTDIAKVEEPETEPETDAGTPPSAGADTPVVVASTATIDWVAARADLASIPSEQRNTQFQVASNGTTLPVPVLLPSGIVIPQGAESEVKFQPLSDGYFAAYPGVDYDIIVNGTNQVLGAGQTGTDEGEIVLNFTPTMTGAQVSFTRYGADYLVEFECNAIENGEADCITEEEALEVTEKLVIAGTR